MIRHGFVALLLSAVALTGYAQSPPRDSSKSTSTPKPAGTGRISGRVVAVESGDPLRNARVTVLPAAGDVPLVLTDSDGRFTFTSLPPGTYVVSAAKSGYAISTSDAGNRANRLVRVQLNDGEAVAGVTVSLARGSAIAGRVLDELGEPIVNTNVTVEELGDAATRSCSKVWTVRTDDLGEYRIGSLPGGEYVVSITPPLPAQGFESRATRSSRSRRFRRLEQRSTRS